MKRGRNQRRRQGGPNPNRALDSNGPDVRIRGTANQIYDKYLALARDASSSGDRVKAESYLQHAEHYFRLIRSMQPAQAPNQHSAAPQDGDSDQPSIDDQDEDMREAPRRAPEPVGASADEGDEGDDNGDDGVEAAPEAVNADADNNDRRPRRRRPHRRPRNDGNGAAADESPAAAE
ncbi:MAG: DUF4167 domain-containing protein [Parvularculaceae bacterium]